MKKSLHFLLTTVLLASFITGAKAQIFFTEDFEGAVGTNGLPTNWTETGLSTDGIWNTGNATDASSAYVAVPAAIQGTNFAYTNDDACNCDKSADRLILPAQDLSALGGARVLFDVYLPSTYGGIGTVEVSIDNGASWVVVNTIGSDPAWQDDLMVDISAYTGAGNTNVLISFLYNDGGAWADAMCIDDVKLEEVTTFEPDMELTTAIGSEYTIIPFSQVTPINLSADVTNVGNANATDATLTVNVYDAANLTTPIQTTASAATAVNASATANLTAGTFTPTAIMDYVFEFITTATDDVNAVNDTMYTNLTIDGNVYARDDANITASFGIGAGPSGYLGSMFTIEATTPVDSVFAAFNKPGTSNTPGDGVGDNTRYLIYDVVGGLPNNIIGESNLYTFTAADTLGVITRTLEIQAAGGGALTLNPGTYFVAVEENNTNIGLAFADNNFLPTTFYYSWTGQPWTPAENFGAGFQKASLIRPILGCALSATTATTDASCGSADGTATVTPANGIAPYTYVWSDGQTTATATNLTAGSYSVTITDGSGCEEEVTDIVVNNPNAPASTASVSSDYNGADISCNGATDGEAMAAATGGTTPYTYEWSDGQTTATATGLAAGTYNVTVIDAASCSSIASVTVTEPTELTTTDAVTDVTTQGGSDGAVDLTVSGGTSPYTYEWSNGETTEDLTGLTAGTYTCTVTDVNGCTVEVSVTVMDGVASLDDNIAGIGSIKLFPNPASAQVTLSIDLTQTSNVNVEVVSSTGQVLDQINGVDVLNSNYVLDIATWSTGVYFVKVQTNEGSGVIRFVKQ